MLYLEIILIIVAGKKIITEVILYSLQFQLFKMTLFSQKRSPLNIDSGAFLIGLDGTNVMRT